MRRTWTLLLLLLLLLLSMGVGLSWTTTTSIRSYSAVAVRENVPIGSEIVDLTKMNARKMKIDLLNVSGFETEYFQVDSSASGVRSKSSIDREALVASRRCFDRSYCSIELHLLVNDGEEYWVVPVHVLE
jgi:hypothetical protein